MRRRALVSISHIADADHRTVHLLHREFVEPVHDGRAGIQRYVPLELADLLCAVRQHEVMSRLGFYYVVGRAVMRLHRLLIKVALTHTFIPPMCPTLYSLSSSTPVYLLYSL